MEFVTFELAKKLKGKGYPQHICDHAYITRDDEEEGKYAFGDREYIPFIPDYLPTIAAPIVSQVLKWLREEKKLHICIDISYDGWFFDISSFYKEDTGVYETELHYLASNLTPDYESYEQAAIAGIEYCLDNLI